MNRTIITLSIASQLLAFGAFAQTTGTSDMASSSSFGSDWSTSLGLAMFGEDGTSVRPSAELSSQWATLSEEDKAMLQRDCAAYMQQSDGSTDATGAAIGTTDGAAAGTNGTAEGAGTTGTAGTSMDTTAGTATDTTTAGIPITVSMDQMEEICAATSDM